MKMRTVLICLVVVVLATGCRYAVPACGALSWWRSVADGGGNGPCSEMCGSRGRVGSCVAGCTAPAVRTAVATGAFGVRVTFVASGDACGTPELPCRFASVGTDAIAPTTDFVLGQAGCDLVVHVRTAPPPSPADSVRDTGLLRFTAAGALCGPAAANWTLEITAVVSVGGGIAVDVCRTSDGNCTRAIDNATAVGPALPWNPESVAEFGSFAPDRAWPAAAELGGGFVEWLTPNSTGALPPPAGNLTAGNSSCIDTAGDADEAGRANAAALIAVLGALAAAGAPPPADGLGACAQLALDAHAAVPVNWSLPLRAVLAAAESWAAGAIPRSAADAERRTAEESGAVILIAFGCAAGIALVFLAVGAIAYSLSSGYVPRRRRPKPAAD